MSGLRIEVQGTATAYQRPERAVIDLTIRSEGPGQVFVADDVAESSAAIRRVLEGICTKDAAGNPTEDAAVTSWSNSSLSTSSYIRHDDVGVQQGRTYSAQTTYGITFRDFSELGEFATDASTMRHVSISNIDWRLTDKTRNTLLRDLRTQAVQDAHQKARDFTALWELADLNFVSIKDNGDSGMSYRMMAARGMGGDQRPNFEPEDVTLSCSVTCVLERQGSGPCVLRH